MTSIFLLSNLLGKALNNKNGGGAFSQTESSITTDKVTAAIVSHSLDSVAVPQPSPTTTTLTTFPLTGAVDTDSSFELDVDILEEFPAVASPVLTAPTPANAEENGEGEEPTYVTVLHPEREGSEGEIEWTELDGELNEKDEAVPTKGDIEVVSLEDGGEQTAAGTGESLQPRVDAGRVNEIERLLEENGKLTDQVWDVQEALRHLHEELEVKSVSIKILNHRLENSQDKVKMLTQEKEQSRSKMEGEKEALSEEIERMKEKIEHLEVEREDLQAKLEVQSGQFDAQKQQMLAARAQAMEELRREVRELKEDKEVLKQQVLAAQAQALEANTKYKHSLEKTKILQDENEHLSNSKSNKPNAATKEQVVVRKTAVVEGRNLSQRPVSAFVLASSAIAPVRDPVKRSSPAPAIPPMQLVGHLWKEAPKQRRLVE
jgi:archaellum component FlaC